MQIKPGSILYARIDYRMGHKSLTKKDFNDHIAYVNGISKERFLLGGGFSNTDGGLILFEASDLQEAQLIAQKDPIIERGFYRCEIFVWELAILSQDKTM